MLPGTSPTWDLSSLPYTVRHRKRYTAGQKDLDHHAHHLNTELLGALSCWPGNRWMGPGPLLPPIGGVASLPWPFSLWFPEPDPANRRKRNML